MSKSNGQQTELLYIAIVPKIQIRRENISMSQEVQNWEVT